MKLSYLTVRNWLQANAAGCRTDQLKELEDIVSAGLLAAQAAEDTYRAALAQAEAAAKSVGLNSVEDLLRLAQAGRGSAGGGPLADAARGQPPRTGVRKPYLDPLRDDGQIHAAPNARRPKPAWWTEAEKAGWSLGECHYARLLDAWRARGVQGYTADPGALHQARKDAEPTRYQRKKR